MLAKRANGPERLKLSSFLAVANEDASAVKIKGTRSRKYKNGMLIFRTPVRMIPIQQIKSVAYLPYSQKMGAACHSPKHFSAPVMYSGRPRLAISSLPIKNIATTPTASSSECVNRGKKADNAACPKRLEYGAKQNQG